MKVENTKLPGVKVIHLDVYVDERGYFSESWNKDRYSDHGINEEFVQDNLSFSNKGVLRGLHFQNPNAQGKLVSVLDGDVYDVAVDVRINSPTFGQWVGVNLSSTNKKQLYVPPGYAHGFCVTSVNALFSYKCTDKYNNKAEHCIHWDDPDLSINWPISNPVVSPKDEQGLRLCDLNDPDLPVYESEPLYQLTGND